jgi:hypothetical protein
MSILKINKEISKLLNKEANLNNNFSYPNELFLVTDSKGKYINSIVPDRFKSFLRIYTKGGAGIHSPIVKRAIENIKVAHNPLVVFWFGTCELSTKSGKFSDIIRNSYQTVEQLLTEYRQIKRDILLANSSAKVVFLECPYFSILLWNKSQSIQYTPSIVRKYTRQDSQLKLVIDYYNQQLELINRSTSIPVPKISKDQIITSTKRRLSRTKQKINFKTLLFDGIHPKRPIARLWMHRIVRFARLQKAHE